jgi:hypothetical protein
MKLKGLLAAAMMMAAVTSMGCKSQQVDGDDVAPEENPDTAPVVTAQAAPEKAHADKANPGTENDAYLSFGLRTYTAPIAPPAARVEVIPASPGPRYFWAPGYYRWTGRSHVWYPGRYMVSRPGYTWVNPYWRSYGGRWSYYRGYWRR